MNRPPEMMTPQESEQWGTALCAALADDNNDRVAEVLASFEPCAANFRLALTAVPSMTRAVVGVLDPAALDAFARPVFEAHADEATIFAGQILATTHNSDHETTQDLISELLRRTHADWEQGVTGPRLMADTLICLVDSLRAALHALRDRSVTP